MTLREMLEVIGIDEEPLQCAFIIAALLRTVVQREASTFEGECAGLVEVSKLVGEMNRPESVRKLLDGLGGIPDMEVPDSLWLQIATADAEE